MAEQSQWYSGGMPETGSAAEAYERFMAPAMFTPWAQDLVELAAPAVGERALDVACGTGVVARLVSSRVGATGKVVGLDLNASMLDVARSLPWAVAAPIEWREADAIELPFDDAAFDLVLCQQGLQFIPDRQAALREMHRVLRPGGRLALSVWRPMQHSPGFDSLHNALTRHIGPEAGISGPFALGDAGELRNLVAGAAFRDITIRPVTKMLSFPSLEEFVWRYLAASPIAPIVARVDDSARTAILDDLSRDLKGYDGEVGLVFPIESHLTLAYAAA